MVLVALVRRTLVRSRATLYVRAPNMDEVGMATRVSHRAGVAALGVAAVLLFLPADGSAQRWRFGLGAAGAYQRWSPAASPADGGSVTFDPSPLALGDATLWLAPSLGLRLDGSFAEPNLVL